MADFPSTRGLLNNDRSGVDLDLFSKDDADDDDEDDFFLCDFFNFSFFFLFLQGRFAFQIKIRFDIRHFEKCSQKLRNHDIESLSPLFSARSSSSLMKSSSLLDFCDSVVAS